MARITFALCVSLAVLALALAGCSKSEQAAGDQAQKIDWKMASSFPATQPLIGDGGPYFPSRHEGARSLHGCVACARARTYSFHTFCL